MSGYGEEQGGGYGGGGEQQRRHEEEGGGYRQEGGGAGGYGQQQGGYGIEQQGGGGYGGDEQRREYREEQGGRGGGGGGYDQQQGEYGGQQQHHQQEVGYGQQQGGRQEYGGGGGQGESDFRDTRHREQHGGSGQPTGYEDDLSGAAKHAKEHSGRPEDSGIFGSVLGMLDKNKDKIANEEVNEGHAVEAHKRLYGGDGSSSGPANEGDMGSAAAMQALKMFTGGGSGSQSSGGGQNAFIGMAMGQASKLFEQQSASGNVAEGASKESAIQKAGEMALKMYMKNQMGGGSSGSMGGLMSMASKFF